MTTLNWHNFKIKQWYQIFTPFFKNRIRRLKNNRGDNVNLTQKGIKIDDINLNKGGPISVQVVEAYITHHFCEIILKLLCFLFSPKIVPIAMSILYLPTKFQGRRRNRRKTGFRKRFVLMAKQQKTRFYILGRCISMLMCWHDHAIQD